MSSEYSMGSAVARAGRINAAVDRIRVPFIGFSSKKVENSRGLKAHNPHSRRMPGVLLCGILQRYAGHCRSPAASTQTGSVADLRESPGTRRPCELYAANSAVDAGWNRGGHCPERFGGGVACVERVSRGRFVLRCWRNFSRAAQADGGSAGAGLAGLRGQCHGRPEDLRARGCEDGGPVPGDHGRGRHRRPVDGPRGIARSRLRTGGRFCRSRPPGNASPGGHLHQHLPGEPVPGHGGRADAPGHCFRAVVRIRGESGRRAGRISGQIFQGPERSDPENGDARHPACADRTFRAAGPNVCDAGIGNLHSAGGLFPAPRRYACWRIC